MGLGYLHLHAAALHIAFSRTCLPLHSVPTVPSAGPWCPHSQSQAVTTRARFGLRGPPGLAQVPASASTNSYLQWIFVSGTAIGRKGCSALPT